MKKILAILIFLTLSLLSLFYGLMTTIDETTFLQFQVNELEESLNELEESLNEPLEGNMMVIGSDYYAVIIFVEGLVVEVKICELDDRDKCEIEIIDFEVEVFRMKDYVSLQMMLTQLLLEAEEELEVEENEID